MSHRFPSARLISACSGIEALETRRLLAASLLNVPTWVEQGPGPIVNGQVAGMPDNPETGSVEAIAVRPGTPATVFIGATAGGIWRTTNIDASPVSWTPLTNLMPTQAISSIAFSPFDTTNQTLFAGTGNFSNGPNGGPSIGILKSTDLGATWRIVGASTFTGRKIRRVVPAVQTLANGSRVHILLVASSSGLHRSTTGGEPLPNGDEGFIRISGRFGSGLPTGSISDLIADPGHVGFFYAAIPGTGIFRSVDFGESWLQVDQHGITGIAATDNIRLAAHFNPTRGTRAIYAALVSSKSLASVWRSETDGLGWSVIGTAPNTNPEGQGINNCSLVADPNDSFTVYVGGDVNADPLALGVGNLFKGEGRTNTWTPIVLSGAAGTAPHADSRSMVFSGSDIFECDDGGIYRLVNAASSSRVWQPLVGNLRVAQVHSAGYDPVRNKLIGTAQDTGAFDQNGQITDSASSRFRWNQPLGMEGDGAIVDVDVRHKDIFGNPEPLRYASSQFLGITFGGFQRIGATIPSIVQLNVDGTGVFSRHLNDTVTTISSGTTPVFDPTLRFNNEFQVNRVDSSRMMIGTNFLYESFGSFGDHLTALGGPPEDLNNNNKDDDLDKQTDEGDEFGPPSASSANVGHVNSIAYGGRLSGSDAPAVAYVGTDGTGGSGGPGFLRTRFSGSGLPAKDSDYPGSAVLDVVLDPQNARKAWVVDDSDRVWVGTNIGLSNEGWLNITGSLAHQVDGAGNPLDLHTVTVVGSGSTAVPLVGGSTGVFRLDQTVSNNLWEEFGAGLPDAQVLDLRWYSDDDVLVAATVGRGVWTIRNASDTVADEPVLLFDGTANGDTVTLLRDPDNPLLLDVISNTANTQRFQLSLVKRIEVDTHDGDDALIVDVTNGPIFVPAGLTFNGGNGSDTYLVEGPGGIVARDEYQAQATTFTYLNVLTYSDNSSLNSTINATQFIADDVGADELTVTGTLHDDRVGLDDGLSLGDGRLRVLLTDTISNITYPNIEFSGKLALRLNSDAPPPEIPLGGDDTITLANTEISQRPALTRVTAFGGFGNDTINVASVPIQTTVGGGGGADVINVGRTVIAGTFPTVIITNTLTSIDAPLTVSGDTESDTLNLRETTIGDGAVGGTLTNQSIIGFGMTGGGVTYSGLEDLSLVLNASPNSVLVRSTASGAATDIDTGFGDDFIRFGSNGSASASGGGNVNGLLGPVKLAAGDGSDTVVIDDSGDTAGSSATLTSSAFSGLGTAGISYGSVESLIMHLGGGSDTLNVRSLAATTSAVINTGAGANLVRFGSAGTGTSPGLGTVNSIDGAITVNSPAGKDVMFFDDSGDTTDNSVTVTTSRVSGLGMAAGVSFTSLEVVSIFTGFGNDVTTNSVPAGQLPTVIFNSSGGTDGILVDAGNGADVVHVQWDFEQLPGVPCTRQEAIDDTAPHIEVAVIVVNGVQYRTQYINGDTIIVFGGNGADRIDTATVAGQKWSMHFEGQNGNDTLIGGAGDDLLVGGKGKDQIEGGGGIDTVIDDDAPAPRPLAAAPAGPWRDLPRPVPVSAGAMIDDERVPSSVDFI